MENQDQKMAQVREELASYREQQSNQNQGRKTKEEILAKYFVPRSEKETFRILPPVPGMGKTILKTYFHVVTVNGSGAKKLKGKVVYCPAHNDAMVEKLDKDGQVMTDQNGKSILVPAPCPACDEKSRILKTQDQSLRGKKKEELNEDELKIWEKNRDIFKAATAWEAKVFYVVKGVDKGKIKDGVKFWRFKHNFKNQGTLDKILPVITAFGDAENALYYDPNEGTDLSIIMIDDTFNGRTYKAISTIMTTGKTKLHDDPTIVNEWVNDTMTWRDVFKPKSAPHITPFEYLEMLVSGTDPYYDDEDSKNKRWIYPGRPELEEKANQRNRDLDADKEKDYSKFQQASDLAKPTITQPSDPQPTADVTKPTT